MNTQQVNYYEQLYEAGGWLQSNSTWVGYHRTQAYTNNPGTGTSISLSVTDTTDFVVGDEVQVSSGVGSETTYITSLVANTSITVNQLLLDHNTSSPLITLLHVFYANGDVSSVIKKRTKVRFIQTTTKYGVVFSVTVSNNRTYIRLVPNTDYSVASGTMSSPSYSYFNDPLNWPGWFNYECYPLGFSVLPTSRVTKWMVVGATLWLNLIYNNAGTSNATTFTASTPCLVALFGAAVNSLTRDNGVSLTTPARTNCTTNTRTINHFSDLASGAWTPANSKNVNVILPFEY